MTIVSLIAALDRKRGIGKGGALPWHLPADLARFKSLTMGHPVIMGRKTHASIGKALPGRRNIVVTGDPAFHGLGIERVHSLDEALQVAGDGEVFVIGGAAIYRAALLKAHRLYLTKIDGEFGADVFFPEFDESAWRVIERTPSAADARNAFACEFIVLERVH